MEMIKNLGAAMPQPKPHYQRGIKGVVLKTLYKNSLHSFLCAHCVCGAKNLPKKVTVCFLKVKICPFDEKAAETYGLIRSQLEKTGKPIGSLDTLIGAHALSIGVTLVTNNIREFKRIKGLKVVDWTA